MVGARVVGRIEVLELLLVDPPDIADRMREALLLRIVAHQLGADFHPGQTELVDRDARDLLLGQLEQHRHRLERPAPLAHALLEQRAVVRGQLQHLDDRIQHLAPVARPLAGDGQTEAGAVVGDDHPVAVEDQPTGGRNRLHVNAVVLRQGGVMLVLDHLQVVHAGNQHAGQQQHYDAADDDATTHQAGVLLVVLQADRLRHRLLLICDTDGRTARSRPGRSARRPGCAPAGAAGSAATATSAARCARTLPAPAPRDRRPSG